MKRINKWPTKSSSDLLGLLVFIWRRERLLVLIRESFRDLADKGKGRRGDKGRFRTWRQGDGETRGGWWTKWT